MAIEKTRGEDQIKAVSFAAGTASFMSLFGHWRVWAFLALNLLLLAILFMTSKSQFPTNEEETDPADEVGSDSMPDKKNKRQECRRPVVEPVKVKKIDEGVELVKNDWKEEDEEEDLISQEELNKRVEAFIAMFRQHLVSDAIMGNNNNNYKSRCYEMKCESKSVFDINSTRRASFSHSNQCITT